jgi:two-component system response regulator
MGKATLVHLQTPECMPDVLLVEDSPDDIELTLRAFRRHDSIHEVAVARDGEEALEYLFYEGRYAGQGPGPLPQLVLLDLNLPKLNGVEVLRRIREDPRTRLLTVVMLSTSSEPGDLELCYAGGANSYVRKPVNYQDFQEVVRLLGRYWLGLNRRPSG